MKTAYLVQHSRPDLVIEDQELLLADGSVGYLFEEYDRVTTLFRVLDDFSPGSIIATAKKKLKDFSDDDAIIAMGSMVIFSICVSQAAEANNGRVTALEWDRRDGFYIPRELVLWGRE